MKNGKQWTVRLKGSPEFVRVYKNYDELLQEAFLAVFGEGFRVDFIIGVGIHDVDVDWRAKLFAEAETDQIHNQGAYEKKPILYKGMRFSSPPEVQIAKALDKVGAMYLANCLARVGSFQARENRFPDFLITWKGNWGILEVDGKTFHMGRASEDHDRFRLFEHHGGIKYSTRYDAMLCQDEPEKVVGEFLKILAGK